MKRFRVIERFEVYLTSEVEVENEEQAIEKHLARTSELSLAVLAQEYAKCSGDSDYEIEETKMRMSKKIRKDCLGCKCSEERFCQLGYGIKHQTLHTPGITKPVPLEPCPKPLTGSDWLKARKSFRKYQTEKL